MTVPYELGYQSVNEELAEAELQIEGTIPDWISGSLIRNGPGQFEIDGESVAHWFDGLAMLHKFTINNGSVTYSNRFLRTHSYQDALEGGEFPGFGSTGSNGYIGKLLALATATTDNTNANVARLGNRFIALTETPDRVQFDPETLTTIGTFEYDDDLREHLATAHPHYDPERGELISYATTFSYHSSYSIRRISDGDRTRQVIGTVSVDEPAYMHDFAVTDNYVLLTEFPFVMSPLDLLRPKNRNKAFIEHYDWKPERGTRFIVLDRNTGMVVAQPRTEAFISFHHANAFERRDEDEANELVLDTVAFDTPSTLGDLYLSNLRSQTATQTDDSPMPGGELRRYHVPLTGSQPIEKDVLYEHGISLPRIAENAVQSEYQYVYGLANQRFVSDSTPNQLLKANVSNGEVQTYDSSHNYFGEPVFVAHPEGTAEDDGIVLSVALDTDTDHSWLLILDANSFQERARAAIPHPVPFDFHGRFFEGVR